MRSGETEGIETRFLSLPPEERVSVITHGATLLLSEWKKRLFLAENKVQYFEKKYRTSLTELEKEGLPDDATHEMHEDYILWHHWTDMAAKARRKVSDLETIATHGLQW